MKSMNNECVNAWKEKKYEYDQQESSVQSAVTLSLLLSTVFHAKKIDFFNSTLSAKYKEDNIVTADKTVYYYDVHLFVSQFQSIAHLQEQKMMQINLHTCLWEFTLIWYATKSSLEWHSLSFFLKDWIHELTSWFKISSSETMKTLLKKKYSVNDVINDQDLMTYIQTVVQHRKSAELFFYNQILFAWQNLDLTLQLHISKLIIVTMKSQFIDSLLDKKEMWICYYSKLRSSWDYSYDNCQASYWYEKQSYKDQSCCLKQFFCHSEYSLNHQNDLNNTFKNTSNLMQYNSYNKQHWNYNVQQLNHSSLLNFTDNEQQLHCIEYSSNKSQFTCWSESQSWNESQAHQVYSSQSAYHAEPYNNNVKFYNEKDSHSADYYTDQNNKTSQSHNNNYVHKAITQHIYKCNECSMIFLTKNQLTYHIYENHYIYFTSTYHLTIISIDHIIVTASIKTINKKS